MDLLAGRAVLRSLHPFMAAELGDRFDLGSALNRGLVPLVWSSSEPEDVLKAYVGLVRGEVAGVFRALRPAGPLDRPEEIAGAALEGLVTQHLRAWIDYSGEDYSLSFGARVGVWLLVALPPALSPVLASGAIRHQPALRRAAGMADPEA